MHNRITPRFSIITVTYNAERVLEDTIQSVIAQNYKNIEYILIDGASTDATPDIIRKYREHIHILISEPDKGLYDAMNKGIKAATGDYLCFLNAGDSLHEDDTIQLMVKSIENAHTPTQTVQLPDILYGQTAIVDNKRHFLHMRRLSAPETLTWKSFKQGMLVCHQAFFANRSIVEPYDLQYRFSSDFDWCIRLMKKARRLHNTHLTIIDYLDEGMTTQNRKASLRERFFIMAKHYGWFSTAFHHLWFAIRLIVKPEK